MGGLLGFGRSQGPSQAEQLNQQALQTFQSQQASNAAALQASIQAENQRQQTLAQQRVQQQQAQDFQSQIQAASVNQANTSLNPALVGARAVSGGFFGADRGTYLGTSGTSRNTFLGG